MLNCGGLHRFLVDGARVVAGDEVLCPWCGQIVPWVCLADDIKARVVSSAASILEGDGDESLLPPVGSEVYVHYDAVLIDPPEGFEAQFDSTWSRDYPMHYSLGCEHAAPMFEAVVKHMHKGDIVEVECLARLAIVKTKWPKGLPVHQVIRYKLQLMHWETIFNVTYDGSVRKKPIVRGQGVATPVDGTCVSVKYTGKVQGKDFHFEDESRGCQLRLCSDDLVEGFEDGLKSMRRGERSIIIIDPSKGFGSIGSALLGIPADAILEYDVELLDFDKACDMWEMTVELKMNLFARAESRYDQAIEHLRYETSIKDETLKRRSTQILIACFANMAAIELKRQNYGLVMDWCTRALELDPFNKKCLYRRGLSYVKRGMPTNALQDLRRGKEAYPEEKYWNPLIAQAEHIILKGERVYKQSFGSWCDRISIGVPADEKSRSD